MTTPICPACGGGLSQQQNVPWVVLTCNTCGGVWTDKDATERVATNVDRELMDIASGAAKKCSGEHQAVSPTDKRSCPICGQALIPIRHARVAIEICREHGTWFDRDELGRMARNSDFERRSQTPQVQGAIRPPTGSSADLIEGMLDD